MQMAKQMRRKNNVGNQLDTIEPNDLVQIEAKADVAGVHLDKQQIKTMIKSPYTRPPDLSTANRGFGNPFTKNSLLNRLEQMELKEQQDQQRVKEKLNSMVVTPHPVDYRPR